jgi:hypothetical protein
MQEKYLRFRFLGSCFIFCGFLQLIENYSVDFIVKSSQVFPVLISITLANFMWTLYDVLRDLDRYFWTQENIYDQWNKLHGINETDIGSKE